MTLQVVIAGGTGFVGHALIEHLRARGDRATVLTRNPDVARAKRDGVAFEAWVPDLSRFDAVVNLAGEPIVGERWNDDVKRRLRSSRIDSTRRLVEAMAKAVKRPSVLVNASAVGIYGERGDDVLAEGAPPGNDFLAQLAADWEHEARKAEALGVRVVTLRIGVVLGRDGGALKSMLPVFKLGAGGPFGSGKQWFPWVHVDDVAGLVLFAIDRAGVRGPLNAAAPGIVTNKEFAKTLGSVLGRPALFPVPKFAARIVIGEAAEFLYTSLRCVPEAALGAGYRFHFPELRPALENVLRKR